MFEMSIRLGDDAMQTAEDVADALRRIAAKLDAGEATGLFQNVHDMNGNPVGTWKFKPTTNEEN